MDILTKISNVFRRKSVEYGGLELLARISAGTWSRTKMLEQYEKSLYVFACTYKIAEKVASTDFNLYQVLNSKGDTKQIVTHPALDLLYKVNPFQTKSEFLKITMINKKLCGDAFWYKVRNERGQVVELWNLRPDLIDIVKDPESYIKAYILNKLDGTKEAFAPEDIVHHKYPTPLDQYFGVSPIKSAHVRIDTEEYASNYQRDFFLNNARPDAALKTESNLTKKQKREMRRSFERRHAGIGNNSRLAIFEAGVEYQQLSISQREMDYIESMKFTRDDILVAFGVPKPLVAITDDVNRANAETAMYIFLSEVIKPELEMLTEKINEELVMPEFGEAYFMDFPDPVPQNREQIRLDNESGIKNGYYLINEVRSNENKPPIDGGWSLYMPFGVEPVGTLPPKLQSKFIKEWEEKQNKEKSIRKMGIFKGKEMLYKKLLIKEEITDKLKEAFIKSDPIKMLKRIKKEEKSPACRMDNESKKDCVGRKIPEILEENPNMDKDQAVAIAENICSEGCKKAPSALIKGEIREKYADMIIKKIDKRSVKMKSGVDKLAKKQEDKLMKKLKKHGDYTKAKSGEIKKAIGKGTKNIINNFYKDEVKVFATFAFPYIEEFVKYAGNEAMELVNPNKEFKITDKIKKALEKRAGEFGLSVNDTTRDKVTRAIADGIEAGESMTQISDRISGVYGEFGTYRSDLIARTETTAANNEGFIEAYKQSDVATHKEWIATMDDRTREEHAELDGEIVKVEENFSNGLPYPQEPNCRCVLGPAFEK